jgi:DNA/RNA endonuclease G (NUC1)
MMLGVGMALQAQTCLQHFPSGMPETSIDQLLCKAAFAIGYRYESQTPVWTSAVLEGDKVALRGKPYKYRFVKDEAIPEQHRAAGFRDCTGISVYERGQLVSYEDVDSPEAMTAAKEAFMLSNVAPQLRQHNSGVWKALEKHVRSLAKRHGRVEVVSGVVFDYGDEMPAMVGNGVMVPTHWYKVVRLGETDGYRGWLVPHKPYEKWVLKDFEVAIERIESAAGVRLFTNRRQFLHGAKEQ